MLTYVSDHLRKDLPSSNLLLKLSDRQWDDAVFLTFLDEIVEQTKNDLTYNKYLVKMKLSYKSSLRTLFRTIVQFNRNSCYSEENRNFRFKTQNVLTDFLRSFVSNELNLQFYETDTVDNALPLFILPTLNRSSRAALNNLSLLYNQDYQSLNTLTLQDFRAIHLANTPEKFENILNQLAEEYKINPFFTKVNESNEYITTNFIERSENNFAKHFAIGSVTPEKVKEYMKIKLEGLKFIASTIVHFNKNIFKSFLTLKLNNSFADYQANEELSFTQLIETSTSLQKEAQFYLNNAFTFFNFQDNTYSPIKDGDQLKIKLLKQNYFAKAKEADVIKELNGLKVYSIFPKEWLDNFSTLSVVNKNINFQKQISPDLAFTKVSQQNLAFSVGPFDDISFVGDFYLHNSQTENTLFDLDSEILTANSWTLPNKLNSKIYSEKETINLSTLCSDSITFTNGKTNVLVFNNFCTGSQPFTFEIKQVTKTQLLNSNNMFVPIAFKTTRIALENLENELPLEEEIYYVSLVNFSNFSNTFRKFTKAQKFMQYFNNLLCTKNSAALSNPQIYEEELARKFGKIIKYSKIQKDKFEKIGNDFVERLTREDPSIKPLIDNSRLSFLNGKLNINQSVLDNLEKLKETKTKIAEKLNIEVEAYNEMINQEKEYKQDILNLQNQIQRFTDLIQENQKQIESIVNTTLKTLPDQIQKQKLKYEKQQELNEKFLSTFEKAFNAYQEEEKRALENNSFIPDSFFDGLSIKGLFLTELVLQDNNTNDLCVFNSQKIQSLTQNLYSKSKIISLEFVIAKPFEIKVDGDSQNIIYAGPLKVKVTNDSIQVAPLNASSIFAFINDSLAVIHPHSSNFNINRSMNIDEMWLYRRGCLGEASPYIYNSFKENSLKMIIVNSLIWLTSANSSDAWGRNYKYFPKKNDINLENLESFAIDVNSLINFIKESEETTKDFDNVEQVFEYLNQEYDEEDDDYCDDHDYNDAGFCIHCGYYNEEYDLTLVNEDEENIAPTSPVYTPYVQLTNTNNNQG